MPDHKLQVVPLGGLGEFGMSCMAIRYGDDIIVIDAGIMFPESELLGFERTRDLAGRPASETARTAQAFGQEDNITVLSITRPKARREVAAV